MMIRTERHVKMNFKANNRNTTYITLGGWILALIGLTISCVYAKQLKVLVRKQKKLNISLQKYKIVNCAGNGPTPMALHWGTHNVAWFKSGCHNFLSSNEDLLDIYCNTLLFLSTLFLFPIIKKTWHLHFSLTKVTSLTHFY